jgi:menaquinol-cytochrome c reductase iron-sulfur subunit
MSSSDPEIPKVDYKKVLSETRRDFLLKVGVGLNVIAGALIGIPVLGFIVSSIIKRPGLSWIGLGQVSQFPENTTRIASFTNPDPRAVDGTTNRIPCWVRNIGGGKFQVFAINCTHLGCPVRWFEQSNLFMCPCHGGVFYANGDHAAGPPPRGLYEYEHKVENNQLMIRGGALPNLADPLKS